MFHKLRPPLRPSPGDVALTRRAISHVQGPVLLLGVTPELSVLGDELVAVDNSPRMLTEVWPGDDKRRRAVLADWTSLPFEDSTFVAVIGDGSLNSAPDHLEQVLQEAARVLAPGGRAVFRVFCSPEAPESLPWIKQHIADGWRGNVHALKWRIAMGLAATRARATVPVESILAAFNEMFPDRLRLASETGWSMDEISTLDAYSGASHSLGFPTLSSMLHLAEPCFSDEMVKWARDYPLCERCPTLVLTKE